MADAIKHSHESTVRGRMRTSIESEYPKTVIVGVRYAAFSLSPVRDGTCPGKTVATWVSSATKSSRSIMGADRALWQPRLETSATWRSCGPTYARTRCPFPMHFPIH